MALDQFRSWATDQIQGGPPGLGPSGLFIASGTFDTPLISSVDGPILKPFGVVRVITVRFDLVYNNAGQVVRYLCKYCENFEPLFELMKCPGYQRK